MKSFDDMTDEEKISSFDHRSCQVPTAKSVLHTLISRYVDAWYISSLVRIEDARRGHLSIHENPRRKSLYVKR